MQTIKELPILIQIALAIKTPELFNKKEYNLQKSIQTEVQIITKKEKVLWMELGISTIRKEKKIIGFSIISRDITDRKQAEKKLLS